NCCPPIRSQIPFGGRNRNLPPAWEGEGLRPRQRGWARPQGKVASGRPPPGGSEPQPDAGYHLVSVGAGVEPGIAGRHVFEPIGAAAEVGVDVLELGIEALGQAELDAAADVVAVVGPGETLDRARLVVVVVGDVR